MKSRGTAEDRGRDEEWRERRNLRGLGPGVSFLFAKEEQKKRRWEDEQHVEVSAVSSHPSTIRPPHLLFS